MHPEKSGDEAKCSKQTMKTDIEDNDNLTSALHCNLFLQRNLFLQHFNVFLLIFGCIDASAKNMTFSRSAFLSSGQFVPQIKNSKNTQDLLFFFFFVISYHQKWRFSWEPRAETSRISGELAVLTDFSHANRHS